MKMKQLNLLVSLLLAAVVAPSAVYAQIPDGYYDGIEGKSERELKTALFEIISDHDHLSYKELWTAFRETDSREDGTVWDMYSDYTFYFGDDQCGNYKDPGDCYNREHSFPKSWFNDGYPMYTDLFHLYPTDGKINGQRGNNPFGECANGEYLSSKARGKLGKSTYPGYSGTVFEPDDEYKGDFARSYFYMATCYEDRFSTFDSEMLAHNSYPCYVDWALQLLLDWHREDPVSEKETDRNNAVYDLQGNRNPFIDYPQLVEYIWGERKDQPFSFSSGLNEHSFADVQITASDGCISIVTTQKLTYFIYDIGGVLVARGENDGTCQIETGLSGIYIVKVVTGKEALIKKLML